MNPNDGGVVLTLPGNAVAFASVHVVRGDACVTAVWFELPAQPPDVTVSRRRAIQITGEPLAGDNPTIIHQRTGGAWLRPFPSLQTDRNTLDMRTDGSPGLTAPI